MTCHVVEGNVWERIPNQQQGPGQRLEDIKLGTNQFDPLLACLDGITALCLLSSLVMPLVGTFLLNPLLPAIREA
ncbi:hypothetical protein I7I50_11534 [Histoplasma capsulatum G186AR]|uniref:Uncharacterized protein n=1 Tax=Ajellomyces capsulatus TaxID=5037 RepID=A0A8H7ZBA5_AJECA|nr:hypothetical protein I7I52_02771 [Histoplasma capsulatum]QSS70037.1 hypothetical protein I7I50_11534 [Histoplasma capsulatum G186AR]